MKIFMISMRAFKATSFSPFVCWFVRNKNNSHTFEKVDSCGNLNFSKFRNRCRINYPLTKEERLDMVYNLRLSFCIHIFVLQMSQGKLIQQSGKNCFDNQLNILFAKWEFMFSCWDSNLQLSCLSRN